MSGISVHREKEAFFGGDGRSRLFTKLFFPYGNYNQVLNNNDADSIVGTDAWGIMSAENHEDNSGMNNTDIHPDFTDFIVQTALFHKEIDKSTRSGTLLEPLTQSINQSVYNALMTQSSNFNNISSANLSLNQPALSANQQNPTSISSILPQNYTNLDALIATLVSIGRDRPVGSSLDQTTQLNFNNPFGNKTLGDYINTFLDQGLLNTVFNDQKVANSLNDLKEAAGQNNPSIVQQAKDASKKNLVNLLNDRFVSIINNSNRSNFDYSNLLSNSQNGNNFKLQLINDITQAIKAGIDQTISNNFGATYTTASNKYVEQFIDKVFAQWDNLTDDTKNFYKTLITLEKIGPNGKWQSVTDQIENEAKNISMAKDRYRVNLKKIAIGESIPYFWYLIPKIPSISSRLYYYDSIGKMLTVDLKQNYNLQGQINMINQNNQSQAPIIPNTQIGGASPNEDLLRYMYLALYQGRPFDPMRGLPNAYDQSRNKTDFPKLGIDKLVRNRLFQIKKSTIPEPKDDEELFDLVTQNIWKRSGDKLYTVKDGKKITHSLDDPDFANLLSSSNKCFTTGAFTDKDNCRLFMNECLLDHNPKNIMSCIKVMEKQDFAQAAKQEINNMTPIVALNLLKRFGFRTYQAYDSEAGCSLTKVEKVSGWLKNYMKKKFDDVTVQSAIEGNDKILQYLNLVVDFVNANPAILNTNYNGSTEEKVGKIEPDSYASKLGIPMRRDNPKIKPLFDIALLDSSLKSNMFGSNYKKPLFVQYNGMNMNNLRTPFGSLINPSFGSVLPVQLGGQYANVNAKRLAEGTSGANLMETIIFNLLTQLKQHGKSLNPEYMTKISQKLELMKKMEKQMIQNIKYIAEYAKLLDAFGDQRSETLSENNLRDIVNSNNNLYKKHGNEEQSMVNILKALYSLAYDNENGNDMKEIDLTSIIGK